MKDDGNKKNNLDFDAEKILVTQPESNTPKMKIEVKPSIFQLSGFGPKTNIWLIKLFNKTRRNNHNSN